MNLSHYQPMDPNMDRGERQKRVEACRNALPPDHEAAIFLLEPGKCPLGLASRHPLFAWSPPVFLGLPHPLRDLCPNTTPPQLLPQRFGIIAFIRREDLEAFTRTAPFARADLDRIQPWHHLGALIPIGGRGPVR